MYAVYLVFQGRTNWKIYNILCKYEAIELQHDLEVNHTCIYQNMIYTIIQASKREMLEQSLQHGIALIRKPIDYFLFKLLNMLRYSKSYFCGFSLNPINPQSLIFGW